jgi:uncharacterized protein (TIGR00369 family)
MPKMTIAELEALMDLGFPDWRTSMQVVSLDERALRLKMPFRPEVLRAGGTVSGPAMMLLADTAAYLLTLARSGPSAGAAATANLDIHFLARPQPVDVVATATMLRLGRRLSVASVDLHAGAELVARATVTYALPPRAG